MELFRPDLKEGFAFSTIYKGHEIQVYIIRRVFKGKFIKGKRKTFMNVWAVSYTRKINDKVGSSETYNENDIIGWDSAHGWFKDTDDTEQYKHIGSALNQAQTYIDLSYKEVV